MRTVSTIREVQSHDQTIIGVHATGESVLKYRYRYLQLGRPMVAMPHCCHLPALRSFFSAWTGTPRVPSRPPISYRILQLPSPLAQVILQHMGGLTPRAQLPPAQAPSPLLALFSRALRSFFSAWIGSPRAPSCASKWPPSWGRWWMPRCCAASIPSRCPGGSRGAGADLASGVPVYAVIYRGFGYEGGADRIYRG